MNEAIYVLLGTILGVCKGQYISINPKATKTNPCENISNTALIEHFFNIVFAEFHNTPPACVCIQMCREQPTYCYPNGCLRRPEKRKVEETTFVMNPVNRAQYESTTKSMSMFIVDSNKDLMDDLLEGPGLNKYIERTEKSQANDVIFHPSPFREMVLKYRKTPKLEMKYNLREQVKNLKSDKLNRDKIDISKTRWPVNKHLLHGKQRFNRISHYKKNEDIRHTKFFMSMFPEYAPVNYTPIFYKKLLTKRENNDGVNVEAMYVYQTDSANFSLETLIDNLIENSLDNRKKNSRINLNIDTNETIDKESTTEVTINFINSNFLQDEDKLVPTSISNTAVSIFSMNSSNENTDVNKYLHGSNMTNDKTFLEMIAGMANEIEKQNKASLELMGRVTGRKNMVSNNLIFTTTDNNSQNNISTAALRVTENILVMNHLANLTAKNNLASSTDFTTTQMPITKTSTYKKNKQRIVRKLKHRKLS